MDEPLTHPSESLGQRLLRARFPHPVREVQLLETHISWVVLTGDWAYKAKKPVRFDFLDYSTLERRREFCLRELEINRIWAEELYVEVVALISGPMGLRVASLDGSVAKDEMVIDYALKMKQFPQSALLGAQLAEQRVTCGDMERMADDLAEMHRRTAVIFQDEQQIFAGAVQPALDNFEFFRKTVVAPANQPLVQRAEQWTQQQIRQWRGLFAQRAAQGRVRQCHGDLHLNNVLAWNDRFVPFDGIEFNDQFSQIDVVNDIAFLAMELSEHGYRPHAYRFRNRYFEVSEDYEGLRLLPYYLVYRAMVRAKVDLIRSLQQGSAPGQFSTEGLRYLQYAQSVIDRPPPELWITYGPSGSGKSTRSLQLVEQHGLFRLRADVVRKRLAGRDPLATTPAAELPIMYGAEMTAKTYGRLRELAGAVIAAGYRAIVDATFLKQHQRESFAQFAASLGVPFRIVPCTASPAELERRLQARGRDPSEATVQVLQAQLASIEPLTESERRYLIADVSLKQPAEE